MSILAIYDLRGFNISQTRVFCDRLAYEYKVHVVMPDFFRGAVGPSNVSLIISWLATYGVWANVSSDLRLVANWLRTNSSNRKIALIGFCWGGLQVVRASANLSDLFFTGVSIHGSLITPDEVRPMKQPVYFIAARNDPALVPNISSVIEESNPNISRRCQYKTYTNVSHGFASAGANYSDPANVEAIDDVHSTIRIYLNRRLADNHSRNLMANFSTCIFFLIFIFGSNFF